MRVPLFKRAREDFTIEYCANCGKYMSVRYVVTVGDERIKVCSGKCGDALKAQHAYDEELKKAEAFAEKL